MQTKKFHIGDILTITMGHLVSPRHIKGVYDILSFMTGDILFTYQLPRAADECKPYLLRQHPQLAETDASGVNEDNYDRWIAEQVRKYGEYLPVNPIPIDDHPIEEIEELMEPGWQGDSHRH